MVGVHRLLAAVGSETGSVRARSLAGFRAALAVMRPVTDAAC